MSEPAIRWLFPRARSASQLIIGIVCSITLFASPKSGLACPQTASVQSDNQTSLRALADQFLAAYQKKDLDRLMSLWYDKSPDLAATRKAFEQDSTANRFEFRNAGVTKVILEGDKAKVRIVADAEAISAKQSGPPSGPVKLNRTLICLKTAGRWSISRYLPSEDDLAAALASAKSDEERNALLAADSELVTVELVQALLAAAGRQLGPDRSRVIDCYALAASIATRINDSRGFAAAMLEIGKIHSSLGNYTQALDYEQKSLMAAQHAGDKPGVALAYNSLGAVYYVHGDYDRALDYYQKSLTVAEEIADQGTIAKAVYNIALVGTNRGELKEPLALFARSLKIFQQMGDKTRTAYTLAHIGSLYASQHDYTRAIQCFTESLTLAADQENKSAIPTTLIALANTRYYTGDLSNALQAYEQCLRIAQEIGTKSETGKALTGMGIVHAAYTNYSIALEYYQRALKIYEELKDPEGISIALHDIGNVHLTRADYSQALRYFQRSLELAKENRDEGGVVAALGAIGVVEELQGNHTQALESHKESLRIAQEKGRVEAIIDALSNIGFVQYRQGKYAEALEMVSRAADLARQNGFLFKILQTQEGIGRVQRALNHPEQARQAFSTAIAAIEQMRTQIGDGDRQPPRFFEQAILSYCEMVDLLISQHSDADALAVAERAKGRVLLDVFQSGKVDISKSLSSAERERERELRADIVSLNSQLQYAKRAERPDIKQLGNLDLRLRKARTDYEALQTNLYAAHPELKVQRGETQPLSLKEVAALIPDTSTALLEFAVTEDKTHVFVLTRNNGPEVTPKVYTVNIREKDLADRVERFRRSLADRSVTFHGPARELYDLLLRPAQAQLLRKSTLIIVPDRALWHLPFQALQPSSSRYLIEDHAVSYAPSLTVLREMMKLKEKRRRTSDNSQELIAFGNPDIAQPTRDRVGPVLMDEKLLSLPEAEKQVKLLGQLYGPAHSKIYLGSEAREARFKKEAASCRILHLATHGLGNDASPMYSYLVLSQDQADQNEDGLLEAWEIMKLDLNADLVVLSACDTARGQIVTGEGVIGLTWAFFVAGCPTTVVSQWKVESGSNTALMVEFHKDLLRERGAQRRPSVSEALRESALKLLRTKKYNHPFYWAPFVVVGDGN
ncbi:MAG TPA: CHAT domain-containing protein [Blastocatellia bacterium]|nr:CHAT domain-containing protein [Blastocatellia bacterium]